MNMLIQFVEGPERKEKKRMDKNKSSNLPNLSALKSEEAGKKPAVPKKRALKHQRVSSSFLRSYTTELRQERPMKVRGAAEGNPNIGRKS